MFEKKLVLAGFAQMFFLTLLLPGGVFAHSVVSPSQTLTSKYETFTLGVPTEKEISTVGVRLVIPEGVDRVTPIVKPGWVILTKKNTEGNVTEITWSGGVIPPGQKDLFLFSARTAASSTTLIWKAYQTYRDGSVVAWDKDPSKPVEGKDKVDNPYSETAVTPDTVAKPTSSSTRSNAISATALALSVCALIFALRKHSHEH